jgi:hypothetical protein
MEKMKVIEQYQGILSGWKPKAGRKPKASEIKAAQDTGLCRVGAKNTIAIAMTLRETGATQEQIRLVLGHSHHNKIKALVVKKAAKLIKAANDNGLTIYKLKLKPQKGNCNLCSMK